MKYLAFLVMVLLSSCVTLSPEGQKVRVTSKPEEVKDCEALKNIRTESGLHSGLSGDGTIRLKTSNNEKSLQNQTAKLGGNVVFVGSTGLHEAGLAYKCPASDPEL